MPDDGEGLDNGGNDAGGGSDEGDGDMVAVVAGMVMMLLVELVVK